MLLSEGLVLEERRYLNEMSRKLEGDLVKSFDFEILPALSEKRTRNE